MRGTGLRSLVMALFAAASLVGMSCGGGGKNARLPVQPLDPIALFADTSYVKYAPGDPVAEASNLEAALRAMGHTVRPFTGTSAAEFTAALSGRNILVIPELELGDLSQDLEPGAASAITDFVTDGGTLVVFNTSPPGFCNDILLVNALFAHTISPPMGTIVGNIVKNEAQAVDTVFEDCCPATLDTLDTVKVLNSATLPSGAKPVYTDDTGNTALAILPEGRGSVIIMGWDWQEARPVGARDGGWWSVLYRAVSSRVFLPEVALVSDDAPTVYASDVVDKLMASGHFARVDTIDAAYSTPSLFQLQGYDALLVYSGVFSGFADTNNLGDVLADYVDQGGGLVTAGGAIIRDPALPQYALKGRYITGQYYLLPEAGFRDGPGNLSSGSVFYSDHPVLAGFLSFHGGTISARADTAAVVAGAAEIIEWADGVPLVATGQINGTRRVDLVFHPASTDADPEFWDASTDGDKILANALTWVADLVTYRYDSYSATISSPAIPDGGATISTVTVSDGPNSISQVIVAVDISHTANQDLDISIRSPGGTSIDLSTDNGGQADGYSGVTFDDTAGRAAGSFVGVDHPFQGSYIPESSLSAYVGTDANGTWSLEVSDDANGEVGTLNSWTLYVR